MVEQRIADLERDMELVKDTLLTVATGILRLQERTDEGFTEVMRKFDALDGHLETRFDEIDTRFDEIVKRLDDKFSEVVGFIKHNQTD